MLGMMWRSTVYYNLGKELLSTLYRISTTGRTFTGSNNNIFMLVTRSWTLHLCFS